MIKQIGLPLSGCPILFNHAYDYSPNWTPISPVTITYYYLFIYIFYQTTSNFILGLSKTDARYIARGLETT